jgi:hypothetical protein
MAFNSDVITTLQSATSMKEIRDVVTNALGHLGSESEDNPLFVSKRGGIPKELGVLLASMNLSPENLR